MPRGHLLSGISQKVGKEETGDLSGPLDPRLLTGTVCVWEKTACRNPDTVTQPFSEPQVSRAASQPYKKPQSFMTLPAAFLRLGNECRVC